MTHYSSISLLAWFLLGSCASLVHAQTNWPQFRGADARGVAKNDRLPDRWSATENVAWKSDIPGRGWSSPIVWKDKIFLTTVVNSGQSEEPKKGLYFGGERLKPSESVHQWLVCCLDLNTGKTLWKKQVHEGKPETPIHIKSSYASETPVTDGERLYCLFGNLGLFCFDLDGKELWTHKIKPNATRLGWGTASSPVLHQGRLYLVNDNEKESYLLALDAKTGKEIWRTERDEKSNWSTPFIWANSKRTEIVTLGSGKVRSYDLDGKLLWSLKGMSSITIATPYEYEGLLYFSSGYVGDSSRPVYAVRPGATGDISLKDGATSNEFVAWSQPKAAPYNPSTLIYKDRLYVLLDRGLVACYDPRNGKEIFAPERLPNGRAFTSSPWAYGDKVFCLNEDGVTYVLQAGNEFKLLHTNTLAEDDMCMATPAIAGDRLLIRTTARLYCIQGKVSKEPRQTKPKQVNYQTEQARPKQPSYQTDADLPYRTGENVTEAMKAKCRLDVYYPTNAKDFNTVVWFHGGGLKSGKRSIPKELQGKGIAVVAVSYRLHPEVKAPAYIEDAAAAVAWTFNNIEKYGGSKKRIFVSGHSAGGYLTMMLGLDKRWLETHQIDANQIAGLVPFSGQAVTHFTIRAERGIKDKQPIIDEFAPLNHVRKDAPPMLLITGDRNKEMLGRYEENAYLWRMMKEVGHKDTELFELQGFDHGGMAEPAHPLLLRFLKKIGEATSATKE